MSSEHTIDRALACSEAQALLFGPKPARLALSQLELAADPQAPRKRIQVWRNHAFEPLVELLQPYARFGRWTPEFMLSAYDDSLMFDQVPEADLHLLWLDNTRLLDKLSPPQWLDWLLQRLRALRRHSSSPVLIATWLEADLAAQLQQGLQALAGVQLANLQTLCEAQACPPLDVRNAGWAGSPLARQAQLITARALACHWLPALLLPPIKAIALDLDHTLYHGVLGEDGAQGVELTPGHRALQQQILALREQGYFLALVSRNERADVEALFRQRPDFPLGWQHFSVAEIGWGDKSAALARIAEQLRIGLDAVLYVDDNPGELAQVSLQHPQIRSAWAHADATQTQAALHHYPGLWRWSRSKEDGRRIEDMQAHAERESLARQSSGAGDYFRSLQVTLEYRLDPQADLARLADLCVKTNQFNLALRRFNGAELQRLLQDETASVCSVGLSDRLSDSGTIAVIVARRVEDRLEVLELCISCRALGRRLEDAIICLALQQMPLLAQCRTVSFQVEHGPRNQPAREWLATWLTRDPAPGRHELDAQRIRQFTAPDGVNLRFQ